VKQKLWWWWWLAGASLLSLFWAFGIHIDSFLRGFVSNQIFLNLPTESLCFVAIMAGMRIWLPPRSFWRWPWCLLATAVLFSYANGIMATNYQALFGVQIPLPSWADVPSVLTYLCFAAALIIFNCQYEPRGSSGPIIDGCVMGIAVIALALIMAPTPMGVGSNFAIIYPAADIVLLGLLARLAIAQDRVNIAGVLLSLGFMCWIAGDIYSGYQQLSSAGVPFSLSDQTYSFSFIFFGAAALHPEMAAISDRAIRLRDLRWPTPVRAIVFSTILLAPLLLLAGALRIWVPWVYGMSAIEIYVFVRL
jgi:hypothetical protein